MDDATLLVRFPDGSWACNDDADGTTLNPMAVFRDPLPGQYDIWVGTVYADRILPGTLHVTEGDLGPTSAGLNNVSDAELDSTAEPSFGSVGLRAGFSPNPHATNVTGGGPVDASYLGGDCVGHATSAPDVRLTWTGVSDWLRIFVVADGAGDTTLLIRLPDGSWACNDDADGTTLNPMVAFHDPLPGQYDIWVGTYEANESVPGTLHLTERDLGPTSVGAPGDGDAELVDTTAEPAFGAVALRAGFTLNPDITNILGGGPVDVSYLGGDCVGHADPPPDVRLTWSGASDWLRIFFNADADEDTTLLVNLPDGTWTCNDDAGSLDPSITLRNPLEGGYNVWVGSYQTNEPIPGTLGFERPE